MKEEALKLADQLDGLNSCEPVIIKACEDMIRRLVEELDFLKDQISFYELKDLGNQKKPLSDEEIKELSELTSDPDPTSFVRAIEERHGIK